MLIYSLTMFTVKYIFYLWQIDEETVAEFIFGGCSHEIKRHLLLLGRKVMNNLDSILKSRDNALPTKVHLVKAMVFPVVMYECDYKER